MARRAGGSAPVLVLVAGLLLSVTSCGVGPAGSTSPRSSPTPAAVTPVDPQEGPVTEDDDGRELVLQPGDELPLQLRSSWSWGTPRVTGDAARLDPVDHLVDPGYTEWLVVGVAPGTAQVEVDGEPACPDPAACPARTVRLTVQVRG